MNRKQLGLLLFVSLVPFIGYLLNPNIAYTDSYAFLMGSCGLHPNFIIPLMPCNIFAIKGILVGLYAVSIFSLAFFGQKVLGKEGWKVGFYSATLSPLIFQLALAFENDIFGWALVFLGFGAFGLGYGQTKRLKKHLYCFLGLCLCFLGTFAWLGAYLGVLTYSLMWLPALVISIPIAAYWLPYILNYFVQWLNPELAIAEEQTGAGIIPVMFVFWASFRWPKNMVFPLATWTSFIIGFLKIKYMLFAVPLLMLNFIKFEEEMKPKFKHWPNLIVVGLVFACAFNIFGFYSAPTQSDFQVIKQGIILSEANELPLYNDWGIGWWVEFSGKDTNYKACYPNPDWNNLSRPYIALTKEKLACEKVSASQSTQLFICRENQ
ncbi:MAG: hypothetical protein H7836_10775 [Magnetococcus sp. YQC-3]